MIANSNTLAYKGSSKVFKKILLISLMAAWMLSGPLMGNAIADPVRTPAMDLDGINTGDTAWMLMSSALVLLMTPGLAFFYGGLVRSRNVLNTMMMSLVLMAVVGVTWILWGYSIAFSSEPTTTDAAKVIFASNPIIGNLNWFGLNKVAFDKADPIGYAATIPHQLFMIYQMMFAIITPALISGAIVERISFKAYFWFILIWSTVILPWLTWYGAKVTSALH
jgi:ammonium transporter, Amt family